MRRQGDKKSEELYPSIPPIYGYPNWTIASKETDGRRLEWKISSNSFADHHAKLKSYRPFLPRLWFPGDIFFVSDD